MAVSVARISQVLMAVIVTACAIFLEIVISGSDIDGRSQSLADSVPRVGVEVVIVAGFAISAIALFRWHKLGWWLSVGLDGLLGLSTVPIVLSDFKHRFMVTLEGRSAFWGDLLIHGVIVLMCIETIGFLLLARKRFFETQG